MMTLDEFFVSFCDELADADRSKLDTSADFKNLNEWDSLAALMVMVMIEDEFNVSIAGDDILKSTTIEDLYNLVISKL